MKAAQITGPGAGFELVERDAPEPAIEGNIAVQYNVTVPDISAPAG
jgi:hypothetical protein